jgi:hypothetical protein
MRTILTMAFVLSLLAVAATAQQPEVKPGPEHEFLKEGEGKWDAVAKSQGKESKGTLSCKMDLNGLWMLEHYQGEVAGIKFSGRGATSYDPAKKKYVNVWIDSMVTSPMISEGTFDKEKKTLTLVGSMPTTEGKTIKSTITIVYKNSNTKTLTLKGAAEGKEFEMVEITYTRAK